MPAMLEYKFLCPRDDSWKLQGGIKLEHLLSAEHQDFAIQNVLTLIPERVPWLQSSASTHPRTVIWHISFQSATVSGTRRCSDLKPTPYILFNFTPLGAVKWKFKITQAFVYTEETQVNLILEYQKLASFQPPWLETNLLQFKWCSQQL